MQKEQEMLAAGDRLLLLGEKVKESEVRENIELLRHIIEFHQQKYYGDDDPVISDAAFDQLFLLLKSWESRFPELVTASSPTGRAGIAAQTALENIRHEIPMLSLDNAFDEADLIEFETRCRNILAREDALAPLDYFLELKFDGLSVSLAYKNDQLVQAATRGNGELGEDVTTNVKTLKSIPINATFSKYGAKRALIRGEILMEKQDFLTLNKARSEAGEKEFANPRNAAAGSLRQLDSSITAQRPLKFYAFEIFLDGEKKTLLTQENSEKVLSDLGFLTSPFKRACDHVKCIVEAVTEVREKRHDFLFEADGVVIKVQDFYTQNLLGFTGHHPRWAIAYKFPAVQTETTLLSVTFQVGRTGVVTPVAELVPVKLEGVTIARATLHNFDEVTNKDFRVGDRVILERAGDVIPHLISPLTAKRTGSEQPIIPPMCCPICDSLLMRESGQVALRCLNAECPAQVAARIAYFTSKAGMDIEHLGPERIQLFLTHNVISGIGDLFFLTKEQLLSLPLFKEKTVNNVLNALDDVKKQPLWRLIAGIGIPLVGPRTARALEEHFGDLWQIADATLEQLLNIHDIGPQVAESIRDFFSLSENRKLLSRLQEARLNFSGSPKKIVATSLTGKKVVLTGSLKTLSREDAKALLLQMGAVPTESVSKKTDMVISGENAGSKHDKALSLGISVLSENDFLAQVPQSLRKAMPDITDSSETPSLF